MKIEDPLRNMLSSQVNYSSEKVTGSEEHPRRLVRDCGALVEVLRRESAWGVNEV
jgi:hypothetical protein